MGKHEKRTQSLQSNHRQSFVSGYPSEEVVKRNHDPSVTDTEFASELMEAGQDNNQEDDGPVFSMLNASYHQQGSSADGRQSRRKE